MAIEHLERSRKERKGKREKITHKFRVKDGTDVKENYTRKFAIFWHLL